MSDLTLDVTTSRLNNEIARLTIERDRYHNALYASHEVIFALGKKVDKGTPATSEEIYAISSIIHREWLFRQHGCPKCGMPCDFFFAMVMIGPHIRSWDCPKCGPIGDVEAANSIKEFAKEAKAAYDKENSQENLISGESDE